MIKINVENKGQGKKIVTYLSNKFNKLPTSSIYKALRNKDIRINDLKITENITLNENDEITLYIKDDILYGKKDSNISKSMIIYEDENIIIVNKPKDMLVQSNEEDSLEKLLSDYLCQKVYACHRLDRNTNGLIIFAKNKSSEEIMLNLIKDRKISKYYKCTVYGHMPKKSDTLYAYLFKDSKNSNVIISDIKKKGYVEIITKYKVLEEKKDNTSVLEVELITGKTHQIRAHLAFINHPIIGDGKYGVNELNKKFGKKTQELESYKIIFNDAYGTLQYLKGKTIKTGG